MMFRYKEREQVEPTPLFDGLWQAYASPASLGFPLSVPSACGPYEILHLKAHLYPILILAGLFPPVKHFFIAGQTFQAFLVNLHECDN